MNHEAVYRTAPATPGLLINMFSEEMKKLILQKYKLVKFI